MSARSAILSALAALLSGDGAGNVLLDQSPAQFDNSTKLATTAFVQQAVGNYQTSFGIPAGTYVATNADLGRYLTFQDTSGNLAVTLPATAASIVGKAITFKVTSTKTLTINRAGTTDLISANGQSFASWTLNTGDDVTFVCVGVGYWFATGSGAIGSSSGFGASLGGAGYQKLPSGLIIQWNGTFNTSASGVAVWTFPIAFPHGIVMNAGNANITGSNYSVVFTSGGATGVSVSAVNTSNALVATSTSLVVLGY